MALNKAAQRAFTSALRRHLVQMQQTASVSSASTLAKIGNRQVVGFGCNGEPAYYDRIDFPMPAIRFKEDTPDVLALREKEKGDWKKLTIEEKKALYRASFCQTFAEVNAPTGEWKSILGISLIASSLAIWVYLWMKVFVYGELPDTLGAEKQEAQLKRIIDLGINPVEGIAAKWDYKKGDWK
ncbi:cytochrome c oxidase subunit 4 isoform 1, mitochondrial-like isoform X2 [Oratosquilla oratoria]